MYAPSKRTETCCNPYTSSEYICLTHANPMKKHLFLLAFTLLSGLKFTNAQTYLYQPDSTFNGDGFKDFIYFNNIDRLFGCALQPDEKLITAGFSKNPNNGRFELAVTRYLVNADFDTSFGTANGTIFIPLGQLNAIGGQTPKVQVAPDGKIVVVASSISSAGNNDVFVCRLDTTGAPDPTFNTTGTISFDMTGTNTFPDAANALDIDANGNVWVAGVTRNGGTPLDNDFAVAKIKSDGTLDPSFDTDGKKLFNLTSTAEFAKSIKVDATGKIVVGGTAGTNMLVLRMDTTGTLDPTFNTTGFTTIQFSINSDMGDMDIDYNNRIVVAGKLITSNSNLCFARLTNTGILDNAFGFLGKYTLNIGNAASVISSIHIQPDNKIIAGGYTNDSIQRNNFLATRITATGSLDLTFNGGGVVQSAIVQGAVDELGNGMAVMNDGRIIITGTITYSSAVNEDCGMLRWVPVLQVGLDDISEQDIRFRAFPNPFTNTLRINSQESGIAELTDIHGKTVKSIPITAGINEISTDELPAGMYLLRVNGSAGLKLIRE